MATDFGRDLWCRTELVTTRIAKGVDLVINRMVRRLTTKKGTLRYHPEWGIDVTEYVGAEFTPDGDQGRRMQNDIVAEIEDEPTVLRGSVESSVLEVKGPTSTTFEISVSGELRTGPFEFVISIDKVTLELIGVRRAS